MGHYEHKGDGALSLLAGRGRAEYGASTMRSGSLTTNAIANGQLESYDVVFDTPMPDTDYLVEIETMRAYALINVDYRTESSPSYKTVNGFRIHVVAAGANLDSFTIKWKAYKLYTDTEYNGLLTDVATLEARTKSSIVNCVLNTALFSGGTVTYAVKDGWCQVNVYNLKPKAAGSSQLITSTPMPKAKMGENLACVIDYKGNPVACIWIDPSVSDTQLNGHFPTDAAVWGTLVYQVADDVG